MELPCGSGSVLLVLGLSEQQQQQGFRILLKVTLHGKTSCVAAYLRFEHPRLKQRVMLNSVETYVAPRNTLVKSRDQSSIFISFRVFTLFVWGNIELRSCAT